MNSQRWTSAEGDVTEGDLGLEKVAQLDICTGTAEDKTSGSTTDSGGKHNNNFHFCILLNSCVCFHWARPHLCLSQMCDSREFS